MKPLKSKKQKPFPPIAVFDIEATDWVNVRVVCHVDEYGNRESFHSVEAYLTWLFE